jgi:hypothetical protein
MDEFQEAFLGQAARKVIDAVRDLKRGIREFATTPREPSYDAEQCAAAQSVAAALQRVELAFSHHRLSDPFRYCDCCTDPAFIARLTSTPRDEISEDDMANVAGSLLNTLGGDDDLRYFVPRFCCDSLSAPLYDVDSAFARFPRAGFDAWPEPEKRAVRDFLAAHWRFLLLDAPPDSLGAALTDQTFVVLDCMMSVGDIEQALRTWDGITAENADARLLQMLDFLDVGEDGIGISGAGGFSDNTAAYESLARWLRTYAVQVRIDTVLEGLRTTDSEKFERIRDVLSALAYRASRTP